MSFLSQGGTLLLAYLALMNQAGVAWWHVPLPVIMDCIARSAVIWADEMTRRREYLAELDRYEEERERKRAAQEPAFETYAEGMQAEREAAAAQQNKAVN